MRPFIMWSIAPTFSLLTQARTLSSAWRCALSLRSLWVHPKTSGAAYIPTVKFTFRHNLAILSEQPVFIKEGQTAGHPFLQCIYFLIIAAYAISHKAGPHTAATKGATHSSKHSRHPAVLPV